MTKPSRCLLFVTAFIIGVRTTACSSIEAASPCVSTNTWSRHGVTQNRWTAVAVRLFFFSFLLLLLASTAVAQDVTATWQLNDNRQDGSHIKCAPAKTGLFVQVGTVFGSESRFTL